MSSMTENGTPGPDPVLEIDGLGIRLPGDKAARPILDGVGLRVRPGETVGLVGESGSGKSVACRSVLGLLAVARGPAVRYGSPGATSSR